MTGSHTLAEAPSEAARAAPEAAPTQRPARQGRTHARRRVTLAQIAHETGLSTATISKVLNGKPDVSARTRALVRQALLTAGYRKRANDTAPPLIDVVFNDFDSPWATEIIRGAAAAAQAEGLTVAFTALSEGDERRVWFDHITSRGTRGIILLLSQLTERQKAVLVARGLPFVVIDPTAEPGPEVSSVGAGFRERDAHRGKKWRHIRATEEMLPTRYSMGRRDHLTSVGALAGAASRRTPRALRAEQLDRQPTTRPDRARSVGSPAALAPNLSHGDMCEIANEWRDSLRTTPRRSRQHRLVRAPARWGGPTQHGTPSATKSLLSVRGHRAPVSGPWLGFLRDRQTRTRVCSG